MKYPYQVLTLICVNEYLKRKVLYLLLSFNCLELFNDYGVIIHQ